jgi:hypothetical protein
MTKPYKPLEIPPRVPGFPVKPANLKQNEETLAQHRARLVRDGRRPLTDDEERKLFPNG